MYYGYGIGGVVVIVLIVLFLMGRIYRSTEHTSGHPLDLGRLGSSPTARSRIRANLDPFVLNRIVRHF